ncbi:MAG TPA: efflux RND transporter permease subunit, partial [Steroidobacteraceae bacterium]|nr:efflux RND transporter permease subunit [Steroidobacteraceae bacterium]
MLAAILRAALRHPLLVVAVAAITLIYGSIALFSAKYDVFPEFVPAQAEIQVEAPGFAPEDVERLITQPLENAINGGANIAAVRSESIQGLAAINVVFVEGSDAFRDRQLLAERISEAAMSLPAGIKAPMLGPMTSSTMDLLKVGFTSKKLGGMELRTLVDKTIRPRLLAVTGVARAIVYGGGRREIQIQVHPVRLRAFDLAMNDVVTAAASVNTARGAGFIDTPTQRVLLANGPGARTPEEIAAIVVSQREGRNVTLGDIATVSYAVEPRFGDARVQGEPDVLVSISSQFGANTLEVTRAVEARLAELAPTLQTQGVNVFPELHRPANFIETALANMRNSLLLGTLFVLAVLIAFLRNWRTALISFVTIPLALLSATLIIARFGWTINTMTLGGLAVAVGVVVDDAIIDVENIMRRLRLADSTRLLTALDAIILNASLEVRRPIVLATFVVGFVFFPILLLPGLQGSFFAPLAAAFLIATFASLLIALTVTPALSFLLLRKRGARSIEPRWMRRLKVTHRALLRSMSTKARGALIVSLAVGVVALGLAFFFGGELIPEFREGHFVAQVSGPAGTSLDEMTRLGALISKRILKIPGIKTVSQQVGRAEGGEDTWATNRCEFHIELERGLSGNEQERIEKSLRKTFEEYPALQSEVVTFLGDRISESFSGETAALAVNIFGPNLDDLDRAANDVADALKQIPGAADVRTQLAAGVPLMSIRPRNARLAALGVRPGDVAEAAALAFQGAIAAQVYEGSQSLSVRVLLDEPSRRDPESIGSMPVKTAAGRQLPLHVLADINLDSARGS